jgi:hypothetical protein
MLLKMEQERRLREMQTEAGAVAGPVCALSLTLLP